MTYVSEGRGSSQRQEKIPQTTFSNLLDIQNIPVFILTLASWSNNLLQYYTTFFSGKNFQATY